MTWNLHCGGIDGPSDTRLRKQATVLAGLEPDLLALQECRRWDEEGERRLLWMAEFLHMVPVAMERSQKGDGTNYTALLYLPSRLRLIARQAVGVGAFHHALLRAHLRPADSPNPSDDFLAFATHLSDADGDSRRREARLTARCTGPFPGRSRRGIYMGDLNTPHPGDTTHWSQAPQNLHTRYRHVLPDGTFGDADVRAMQVLLDSGWEDPEALTGQPRGATVGHFDDSEPEPLRLDHILVQGLSPMTYFTYDKSSARAVSDHLPVVLDTEI
ncbi:endonuclease/exonuclease/phosphatase family protein [Streptomyces sp. NEAU-S7GS2]|uniref:endonuclease/exonuclease/phosphatase family protein n=1 Tax=Streptomyces sp. NEAU-S7GS2 TaxID=2202000 RepID=UPI001EF7381D|nr:endonuclease/exonuclease/phosphatase family protein [Streptomyces sp. NEAU-S7GS2]